MGWHSRCCGSQRRRKPRLRHSSRLLESSCPKPSPAGQARPATSIHTFAPKVRPFFRAPPPTKRILFVLRLRRQKYQQVVKTGDFVKKTQKNMGTPVAADAPWSSSPQHACLTWTGWLYRTTASQPPRLQNAHKSRFAHTRRGAARNAVGATRAGKRREALLHARVV